MTFNLAPPPDPTPCRFKRADAEHTCVNREGAPVNAHQECWHEARADFLEGIGATLTEADAVLERAERILRGAGFGVA